jgi:RNA polymerase sigma factor (TIGR02999 family)
MSVESGESVTQLLGRARDGDRAALDTLFQRLYPELRQLAHARLRRAGPLTLLDTVGLLHEAYVRLVRAGTLDVASRGHFLAYAARAMRSVVIDFARARQAERRGGKHRDVTLDTAIAEDAGDGEEQVLRVHEALEELAQVDERLVRVVEMRYFAGLTEQEIGEALGVPERTVRRDWEKARVLLAVAMK